MTTEPLPLRAVLFDRDGTLVLDVPYNGDPALVELVPGAAEAFVRVRSAGLLTALVTNQSGIARGLLVGDEVDAVHARLTELVGSLGPVLVCPHGPTDGCDCRKPRPGLVLGAAAELGVDVAACVVIGDRGSDVRAGLAAGARAVLVPSPSTTAQEIADAPLVASTLARALDLLGVS